MDVKTSFLNGELDEEVYMNQPYGFIITGNENKACKLIKCLYGLKQAPKQCHQKFDKVILSNGYLLNQADKCVYRKFDETSKGVIICLYVDDMLIFDTNQVQVDLTKEFLSSRFSMKDIGEADVILGIRIKHESNRIAIYESHYIEKGDWLLDHWQAIQRVLKYLKKTMDYSLTYTGYSSILEGYTDASWISNTEDNSSTSGWVFLLGGSAISWASKKQTCITRSTMRKPKFVALAASWNCIKLGRIVGNLVQLWVQFIPGYETGGKMDETSVIFRKNGEYSQTVSTIAKKAKEIEEQE
ncbi:zinc finger, CCHC-type containing protein [Tanacetum coccineum]